MLTPLSVAVAYIHENGEELERARLTGLLGRSRVEPKVARSLLARQNEDGGFPFGLIPGRPSAVKVPATAGFWGHADLNAGGSPVGFGYMGWVIGLNNTSLQAFMYPIPLDKDDTEDLGSAITDRPRSEEHTSELQSPLNL